MSKTKIALVQMKMSSDPKKILKMLSTKLIMQQKKAQK